MAFKSPTQPYCRCCGGPIGKRTENHYFGAGETSMAADPARNHAEKPTTKAEAQRLINGRVVGIRRWDFQGENYVQFASVWDGESYDDHLFCKQACAVAFGRMCATEYPAIETQRAATARAKRHKDPI